MERSAHGYVFVTLMLILLMAGMANPASGTESRGLDDLVTSAEKQFLLDELARVQPPERLRELSKYGQRQLDLGGGFYGILPDQLSDPDSIPLPIDEVGSLKAALHLARQRDTNLVALRQINPEYALTFGGEHLSSFLERFAANVPAEGELAGAWFLDLDTSALVGFFDALADGEVSADEAAALVALPSNQAALRHRLNLGYVPEPLPNSESIAEMIQMAGSTDPLDRLWCWINPQNAFSYADLVQNADGYLRFLADLEEHGEGLVTATLVQIRAHAPTDLRLEARFALTAGWGIRGWVTPGMAGLNVEQTKDDWDLLTRTLIEETYHRLQLQLCRSPNDKPAETFDDLVTIQTGDVRFDHLYEAITYTVLEGAANFACGQFTSVAVMDKTSAGAELMTRFVEQVVEQGDVEGAQEIITEGLKGNGPLYGLGWKLASLIAERDGDRAVGDYQRLGPVRFFQRGATLAVQNGEPLVPPNVMAAVDSLEALLGR